MELKTFLLSLLMVVLMGSSVIIEKMTLKGDSAFAILAIRSCFMSLCFLLIAAFTGGWRSLVAVAPKTQLLVVIAGVMGVVFLYLYYTILKQDLASRVFPILSAAPIVTLILAVTVLGEPFTWKRLVGILLVVAGVALIR